MTKLLRANVRRYTHGTIFWLVVAATCVKPLYIVLNNYYYAKLWHHSYPPDNALVGSLTGYIFPLALAVFVSVFIGTEYLNKTIRNKLIVGHSRSSVYLSNLFVSVLAAMMMYAAALAVAVGVGIPLLGSYETTIKVIVPQLGYSVLSVAALASIYTVIVMLVNNMVAAGLSAVLLGTALAYLPQFLWERVYISVEELRTGFAYNTCKVLYDILPTCQLYRCTPQAEKLPEKIWIFPIYSLLIISVTTVIGVHFFQKKNLN